MLRCLCLVGELGAPLSLLAGDRCPHRIAWTRPAKDSASATAQKLRTTPLRHRAPAVGEEARVAASALQLPGYFSGKLSSPKGRLSLCLHSSSLSLFPSLSIWFSLSFSLGCSLFRSAVRTYRLPDSIEDPGFPTGGDAGRRLRCVYFYSLRVPLFSPLFFPPLPGEPARVLCESLSVCLCMIFSFSGPVKM